MRGPVRVRPRRSLSCGAPRHPSGPLLPGPPSRPRWRSSSPRTRSISPRPWVPPPARVRVPAGVVAPAVPATAGVVRAPGPAAVGTDRGQDPESLPPVRDPSTEVPLVAPDPLARSGLIREEEATIRPPRPQVPPTPRPPRRSPQLQGRACPPAADTPRPDRTAFRRTPPCSDRPELKRRVPADSSEPTGWSPYGAASDAS